MTWSDYGLPLGATHAPLGLQQILGVAEALRERMTKSLATTFLGSVPPRMIRFVVTTGGTVGVGGSTWPRYPAECTLASGTKEIRCVRPAVLIATPAAGYSFVRWAGDIAVAGHAYDGNSYLVTDGTPLGGVWIAVALPSDTSLCIKAVFKPTGAADPADPAEPPAWGVVRNALLDLRRLVEVAAKSCFCDEVRYPLGELDGAVHPTWATDGAGTLTNFFAQINGGTTWSNPTPSGWLASDLDELIAAIRLLKTPLVPASYNVLSLGADTAWDSNYYQYMLQYYYSHAGGGTTCEAAKEMWANGNPSPPADENHFIPAWAPPGWHWPGGLDMAPPGFALRLGYPVADTFNIVSINSRWWIHGNLAGSGGSSCKVWIMCGKPTSDWFMIQPQNWDVNTTILRAPVAAPDVFKRFGMETLTPNADSHTAYLADQQPPTDVACPALREQVVVGFQLNGHCATLHDVAWDFD